MEKETGHRYSAKEYNFICRMIWGGAPVDRKWAEGTKLFESEAPKILEKYPMLDKSLHEEWEKSK